jgi:hypothetical protein
MNALGAIPDAARTREAEVLMDPLLRWLVTTRRLRNSGGVFLELPWAGRRVDLVTLGKRLRTSAYELKLSDTRRALEQAIYNRAVFDRSYIVVGQLPSAAALAQATACGVGVLLIRRNVVRLVVESPLERPHPAVRKRLLAALRGRSPQELRQ